MLGYAMNKSSKLMHKWSSKEEKKIEVVVTATTRGQPHMVHAHLFLPVYLAHAQKRAKAFCIVLINGKYMFIIMY